MAKNGPIDRSEVSTAPDIWVSTDPTVTAERNGLRLSETLGPGLEGRGVSEAARNEQEPSLQRPAVL